MVSALAAGFGLGLAIAISPGPISLLWLRRTLERGWLSGLSSGLGIAVADSVYAALGAFGIAAVTGVLLGQSRWLRLAGGLALLALGIRSLLAAPGPVPGSPRNRQISWGGVTERAAAADFASMLALTLANPQTILFYAAAFAGLGLRPAPGSAALLVVGAFAGSEAWWLLAATVVTRLRSRVGPRTTLALRLVSGVALAAFGLGAILSALPSP